MFEKIKRSLSVLLAITMIAGTAGTSTTTVLAGESYDSDYTEQSEESSYVEGDDGEVILNDQSSSDEPGEITQGGTEAYIDSDQSIGNAVSGDIDTSIIQDTTSQEDPTTQSTEAPQDVTASTEEPTAQEDTTSQDDTTSEEDAATEEETTTEEEAAAFDQYESVVIDDNNKLYIHITAPEGVLPAGSYFTVKKIDRTADTEAYVSVKRAANAFVFESYVLDMTMYNKDGEKIQPDTANGRVSIVMGINSMSAEPQKAADAVKKEIAAGALNELAAIYQDTEIELSAEDIGSVIDEVLEETDISYSADAISLDIYHIPDNASYADFLYTDRIYNDNAISYAERLVQTYTDSFSEYPVELSVYCDISELTQNIVTSAAELIDEALAAAGDNNIELAKTTYDIIGELEFKTDEMTISDIISNLKTKSMLPSTFEEPVKQVVSLSSRNPAITINEKSPLPNYDASVTVGRGGQRGTISIYDAMGDEYKLTVYNALPTVSEYYDQLEFDVIWNDNSGSTALDKTNLVDRPDGGSNNYKYIKDNYVLQFKADGAEEWNNLTADNYTQAGLDKPMDITGSDGKAVNASGGIWTFIYDDVNKLPKKYLENGQEHTVEFRIVQKSVQNGYDAATTGGDTETIYADTDTSIINTVQTKFSAQLKWLDNNNSYETRVTDDNFIQNYVALRVQAYDGSEVRYLDASQLSYDAETGIFNLQGLPNYDSNRNQLYYSIQVGNITRDESGQITDVTSDIKYTSDSGKSGVDGYGGYYISTYKNDDISATRMDALYNGGILTEKLCNTTNFSYSKYWHDGDTTEEERTAPKIYMYAISSETVLNSDDTKLDISEASPVNGFGTENVPTHDETDVKVGANMEYSLPMYDANGTRLVYFIRETNLAAGYVSDIDNNKANPCKLDKEETAEIIEKFNTLTDNSGNVKYILNGGTVENKKSEPVTVDVQVTLDAVSMQSADGISVKLQLQKWDRKTSQWVNVDTDIDGDPMPEAVLDGFSGNAMTKTASSRWVNKYDDEGYEITYRYIQTAFGFEDNYIPLKYTNGAAYETEYNLEKAVIGRHAAGIDGINATAYISGTLEVAGVRKTVIYNVIQANIVIESVKKWTDSNEDVTDKLSDEAYARFRITRNDGMHSISKNETPDEYTLRDSDDKIVYDAYLNKSNSWVNYTDNLERFDESGMEYTYLTSEIEEYDGGYIIDKYGEDAGNYEWGQTISYYQCITDPTSGHTIITSNDQVCGQADKTIVGTISNVLIKPGDGIGIAFMKKWQDGGDLLSRRSCIFAIYKIENTAQEDTPQLLDLVSLSESTNWYYEHAYAKGMTCLDGSILTEAGSQEDYVVVEAGTADYNGENIAYNYYNSKKYDELSIADLRAIKTSQDGMTSVGTVASDETDPNGYSEYTYNVTSEYGEIISDISGYTITNTRVADVGMDMSKTWADGGKRRTSRFVLYRYNSTDIKYEDPTTIWEFSLPAEGSGSKPQTGSSNNFSYEYKEEGKTSSISIRGLDKYDAKGNAYIYRIVETGIVDKKTGTVIPIENGTAIVSGDRYVCNTADVSEEYGELHNSHDLFIKKSYNTLSDTTSVSLNKVWYDDGLSDTLEHRPSIYFKVYRMSANYDVEYDETTINLAEYIESDDFDATKFSEIFNAAVGEMNPETFAEKVADIKDDRMWDASANVFYWSCELNELSKFNEEGERYIYFAVEGGIENSLYTAFYGNMTSETLYPVNVSNPSSGKDIYDIYSVDSYDSCADDNVLIINDGYHGSNYYSRTVVNRIEDNRKISGRKLWSVPSSLQLPDSQMPEVKMQLYKTTDPITDDSGNIKYNYTNEDIDTAVAADDITWVADFRLHTSEAGAFNFDSYTYSIANEQNEDGSAGSKLQRYDKYGMPYYYYIREASEYDGYDRSDTTYSLLDLSAVNNYVPEQSKVQIEVSKTWKKNPVSLLDELSDSEAESRDQYNKSINVEDLEPIEFTLTAYLEEDRKNTEIELGTATLSPKDESRVINKDGSITVSYLFEKYTDESGEESNIPYYAANGQAYKFAITEKCPDGYEVTPSSGTIDVELHLHEVTTSHGVISKTYTNFGQEVDEDGKVISEDVDKIAKFTNTYTGTETEFTVYKKWNDGYVDNSRFRPYKIIFTIYRYTINENNEKVQDPNFFRWLHVDASVGWKDTKTKLEKYDINGNLFHYYIGKEELRSKNDFYGVASNIGDTVNVGNVSYKLTEKTENSFTNELTDKTSVSFEKDWKISGNGARINWPLFEKLRSMNILPASAAYIVQRSIDGKNWEYVPASSDGSAQYKVTVGEQSVVGCEIDITKITPATFDQQFYFATKFDNLPKNDENDKAYTYRVIERLKWAGDNTYYYYYTDGTLQRATQFKIQADSSGKYTACNYVSVSKGRVAKYWKDDNDFDNTRPESIKITISQNSDAGQLSFVVNVDATGSKYISEEFYIVDENIMNPCEQNQDGTLKNYTVTEEYTYSDGRTDLYVHDGKDVTVEKDPDTDAYIFNINNNYSGRKLVKIEAAKVWNEPGVLEAYKKWQTEITRPKLLFTLQYKDPTTKKWTSMTDETISKFTADSSVTAAKLIDPSDQSGTSVTVSWDNLYKYWKSDQLDTGVPVIRDGEPKIIEYRVVGKFVVQDGSITDLEQYDYVSSKGDSDFFDIIDYGSFTENKNTYTGSVTNTQNGYRLYVTKKFVSGDDHELTWNEVSLLQKLNALPVAIDVQIEYAVGDSDEYEPLSFFASGDTASVYRLEINENTYNKATDISGSSRLIKYDKNGELIKYRVSEVAVYYADNEKVSLGQNTAVIGNFEVTQPAVIDLKNAENKNAVITNEYASGSIAVNKIWKDEGNRDALAGDVKLKLTGLNENRYVELTLNKNNSWSDSTSWIYIPVKDHTGTADVTYTVDEISINGRAVSAKTQEGTTVVTDGSYIVTYSDGTSAVNSGTLTEGSTLSIAVTNTYVPARGSIDAVKTWIDDSEWADVIRPESVDVSLEYKTTGDWTQVSQNTLGSDGLYIVDDTHPEGGIYTTSAPSQTLTADEITGEWTKASWENLPVNYNNNGIAQKVMYRVVETSVSGYTTAYTYTLNDDGTPQAVSNSGMSFNTNGDAAHVTVSNTAELGTLSVYKAWHNSTITDKNISSDKLSALIDLGLLPKTLYMAVEYSTTPDDAASWKTIPVELETGMDDGWFSFDTINDYNGKVNVVSKLPKFANNVNRSPICYRVAEMGADYVYQNTVSYEARTGSTIGNIIPSGDDNHAFAWAQNISANIVNTYESVNVKALKNWYDEKNRDALRSAVNVTLNVSLGMQTRAVETVELNYDAAITRSTVPAGENGLTDYGWAYTWSNLPSKAYDGTSLTYSMTESGISSEYTVRYEPEKVSGSSGETLIIDVNNIHVPDRGIITANKIWTADQKGLFDSRDTVKAALQYSLDNASTWKFVTGNVSIIDGFYSGTDESYTTSAAVQTIYDAATGTSYTAKWEKVPVNCNNDENAGTKTQILYRVVEVTGDEETGYTVIETGTELGGYTAHASSNIKLTNNAKAEGNVENELKSVTSLNIEKTWTGDDLIYSADGAKVVSELTRPQSITFKVEYKIGSGEWRDLPATSEGADYGSTEVAIGGLVTVTGSQADNTWTASLSGLPAEDMLGNEYSYRVSETALTYVDGTKVDVTGTFDEQTQSIWTSGSVGAYTGKVTITKNEAGVFKAAAENTLAAGELTVTKQWKDEADRDQLRDDLTVNLYRDMPEGTSDVDKVQYLVDSDVLSEENGWTVIWHNLPKYKNTGNYELSVYTVEEIQNDGYEAPVYSTEGGRIVIENESAEETVVNVHYPDKGVITADKIWDDSSDAYEIRPEVIYLTLKYRIEGSDEWQMVLNDEDQLETDAYITKALYKDGKVRTTSDVIQKVISSDGDSQTVQWLNLPVTVLNDDGAVTAIYYKVFETDEQGNDITDYAGAGASADLPNYTITYSAIDGTTFANASEMAGELAASQTITNTLVDTELEINKTWIGDDGRITDDMTSAQMVRPESIKFRIEYLAEGVGESAEWKDVPKTGENNLDEDGFVSMYGGEDEAWTSVRLFKLPLYDAQGNKYNYRVSEYSITVDGTEILCGTGASGTEQAGAYIGTVDISYDELTNTWQANAENTLPVGSLHVDKTWDDADNRDGIRPEAITLTLYRIDTVNGESVTEKLETVTIAAADDGSMSYTWNNLPVYSTDGKSYSEYYVAEENISGEYKAYYRADISKTEGAEDPIAAKVQLTDAEQSIINITNSHDIKTFTINADKMWNDYSNKYQKRDTSVTFTLEYSLDNGKTWSKAAQKSAEDRRNDDGKSVWTSSKVSQVVTGDASTDIWSGASWKDVTAYALDSNGKSVEVLYKVTETATGNNCYTIIAGDTVSYGKAGNTQTVKVTIENRMTTIPKTGDESNAGMWMLIMGAALAAMLGSGVTLRVNRKRQYKK